MEIIKLLKKRLDDLFNNKTEIKQESISFSELPNWITNKEKEIFKVEEEIAISIKEKFSLFMVDVNEKLDLLDNVNLDNTKENNRTKHIVLTNFKEYVKLVQNLLDEIKNYERLNFSNLNDLIHNSFLNFNKRAHIKYERATYLIGKELGDVNISIQEFIKNYSKIIEENKDIIESKKIINEIKEKLKNFESDKKEKKKIDFNITEIKKEIKNFKQEIISNSLEIKTIESSDAYTENLNNIELKKKLQIEISRDIINLRQLIDFKTLTKIFHEIEKYREIVKNFKDKFEESFKEDKGKTLLDLLDESKLNNETIKGKIKIINDKIVTEKNIKLNSENDKITNFTEKIKQAESNINQLNDEIGKENKRNEKIDGSLLSIKDSIKEKMLKLNVDILKN